MKRPRVLMAIAISMATSWIAACVHRGAPANPFAVSPDNLFGRIRTLAVAPVTASVELDLSGHSVAKLETVLEDRLEQAGFNVVPAYEYLGIWQHIADGFGGFYDTHTGERDDESYRLATEQMRQELRDRHEVDGVLFPELRDGMVPFRYGVAKWDGASQGVSGAYGLSGEVRAISLVVAIEDLAGTELFANGFGFATIDAWHDGDWLSLDLDAVVEDSRLISEAVTGVLAPIVEAIPADSSGMLRHLPASADHEDHST